MVYGAKCPKCGLMQLPNPTCKACGAALAAPLEAPRKVSSRGPSKVPSRDTSRSLSADPSTIAPRDPSGDHLAGSSGVSPGVPPRVHPELSLEGPPEDRVRKTAMRELSRCSECGLVFSEEELIQFGDALVCAKCKPLFVQSLREGVAVAGEMVYGGFWIRVGAKIIDGIVLSVVGFALGIVGSFITSDAIARIVFQNILSLVLSVGYTIYFLGAYSATPGKMACGLRVVRSDGEKISYARACGRFFAELVSSLILGIGYLMVIFDDEKRALHDRICDTRVVKKA